MSRLLFSTAAAVDPAEDLSHMLGPARVMFQEQLVERIMALEAYRRLAGLSQQPLIEMKKIADIAHKIAGVGATLGFSAAGGLAARLDRAISDNPARCAEPWYMAEVVDPILEALLDEMEALLDA